MFVNARSRALRDLLSAIVAIGIDYYNFTEAGDGFQTTRKIISLVMSQNDNGERFRHSAISLDPKQTKRNPADISGRCRKGRANIVAREQSAIKFRVHFHAITFLLPLLQQRVFINRIRRQENASVAS